MKSLLITNAFHNMILKKMFNVIRRTFEKNNALFN